MLSLDTSEVTEKRISDVKQYLAKKLGVSLYSPS